MSMTKYNEIVTVLGQKGYGKTYLLINTIITKYPRVIILDTMAEFKDNKSINVSSAVELVDAYEVLQEKKSWKIVLNSGRFEEYEKVFLIAPEISNFTLVIDEIDKFAEPSTIHPDLKNLYNVGRHYSIDLISASRRPAQVNRIVTSQSDLLVFFHTNEPNDLAYIKKYTGRGYPEIIAELEKRDYVWYGDSELAHKLDLKENPNIEGHVEAEKPNIIEKAEKSSKKA